MHSTPLFDATPATPVAPPTEIETRRKARASAFSKADKWVMDGYRHLLINVVGRVMPTFGAWDVTRQWEKRHGKLAKHNQKALGQLFATLLDDKVIVPAGAGRRPNGNLGPQYSLKK